MLAWIFDGYCEGLIPCCSAALQDPCPIACNGVIDLSAVLSIYHRCPAKFIIAGHYVFLEYVVS